MRIAYVPRTEALQTLRNVAPEDLIQELIDRGVTAVLPSPSALLNKLSECPHCGKKGKVGKEFGVRVLGGTVRPQSWCRDCRKNPSKSGRKPQGNDKNPVGRTPKGPRDTVELLKASLKNAGLRKSDLAKLQKALFRVGS
jgi:hypothetical protein